MGDDGGESEKMSERWLLVVGEEGEGGVEGGVRAMVSECDGCYFHARVLASF